MYKKTFFAAVMVAVVMAIGGNAKAYESITPETAFDMVTGNDDSEVAYYMASEESQDVYILDVRTIAEWAWVGHPGANKIIDDDTGLPEGADLEGKVVNISYLIERNGEKIYNNKFLVDVRKMFGDNPNVVLITMCRSGKRSKAAAQLLEAEGYTVYNMATGFEGAKDKAGYRTVNGWKNDGLPYSYSGTGYIHPGNGFMK